MRIVFMGTPDFAVPSLRILLENGYDIAGVITAPDKPAGRGQQLRESPVKKFAASEGLPLLQPEKLKDEAFLAKLRSLEASLFVVVAFRMLPEAVWNMPPLGTINLHASLLPQYRGAAPIQRAVMNGESESGVSTFFLQQEIDTGRVLFQEKVPVGPDETAGELHDRLMETGAGLVLKTVKAIESGDIDPIPQEKLIREAGGELKVAPKIFKEECRINWDQPARRVHDFIRGLSPHPGAFTELNGKTFKIYKSRVEHAMHGHSPGSFHIDAGGMRIAAREGYIIPEEIQLEGKKRMTTKEFLKGYRHNES